MNLFNVYKVSHVLRPWHKNQNAAIWNVQIDPWISTVQVNFKRLLLHSRFKNRFHFIYRIAKIFSFQLSLEFFKLYNYLWFLNIFKSVTDLSLVFFFFFILLGLCKENTEEHMEILRNQRISEVKGHDPSNACWPDPLEVYLKQGRTISMPFWLFTLKLFPAEGYTWPFILRNK